MERSIAKTAFIVIVLLAVFSTGSVCAQQNTLTQVSTIDALMSGIYDGEVTLSMLKEKGDFGLGTFNTLDGEMVVLDGHIYKVTVLGNVEEPALETKTPFAAVTFFKPGKSAPLAEGLTFPEFTAGTDKMLPTENIFYAFKITGTFQYVKARSVPAQKKPYKPLSEAIKEQAIFNLPEVKGTIVGFRCPLYVKGVNVPGYHLHFLRADGKAGGHVVDFKVRVATMETEEIRNLSVMLPSDEVFYKADLTPDREKELKAVEK